MIDELELYDEDELKEFALAKDLIQKIVERCKKAKIECIDESSSDLDDDKFITDVDLTISLNSGRRKRDVYLWDTSDLKAFDDIKFEQLNVIGHYSAIFDYETNTIEAIFSQIFNGTRTSTIAKRRILSGFGVEHVERDGYFDEVEVVGGGSGKVKIFISPISDELSIISGAGANGIGSIKIVTHKIQSHADALKILEKVANSLFFSMEITNHTPLQLQRRTPRGLGITRKRKLDKVSYPNYEYDDGPLSLYWYARSAINMPLLQFLAFYQAIEFYYPTYFKFEYNRKIRSILKDPSFNIERDSDISRITSILSSRVGGTEKEQLKATLHECVDVEDLKDFIQSDPKRMEFLTTKQKSITGHIVNFKNRNMDLISQIAERVYDIRCKVVHVKSEDGDSDVDLLLPYTEEADNLLHDIELVQYLAQKVLICSSSQAKF